MPRNNRGITHCGDAKPGQSRTMEREAEAEAMLLCATRMSRILVRRPGPLGLFIFTAGASEIKHQILLQKLISVYSAPKGPLLCV